MRSGERESARTDTLDRHFKIIPIQRWQLISSIETIESHPLCRYRDRLEISRRQAVQTLGNLLCRQFGREGSAPQITAEQLCSLVGVRKGDLNLFREPPSAENTGIDVFRMISGANQKNIVLWPQTADFRKELLYQLNIVLREGVTVCWQQSIHFVEKNNGRTVFFGTFKNSGYVLDGISNSSAKDVGSS